MKLWKFVREIRRKKYDDALASIFESLTIRYVI
jgi:hypothetical protein